MDDAREREIIYLDMSPQYHSASSRLWLESALLTISGILWAVLDSGGIDSMLGCLDDPRRGGMAAMDGELQPVTTVSFIRKIYKWQFIQGRSV